MKLILQGPETMNKILQLARSAKTLLLALSMLFFVADADAAPCDGMLGERYDLWASKIDSASVVRVNGLDLTAKTTTQQWRKAFGKKGTVTKVIHANMEHDDEMIGGECIPLHLVTVSYPDKIIHLTLPYFLNEDIEEVTEFKALEFDQDFVKQNDNMGVQLEIDWNMNKFKDLVIVGKHTIKPNLSFDEFKKLFPLSSQQSLAALIVIAGYNEDNEEWKHERRNENQTYVVDINSEGCLNRTLEFTFSKAKLSRLALRRYESWCSGC